MPSYLFIPGVGLVLLQVRDLENNFSMALTNAVPSYLERYGSAADNPELEALPEEVQVMLGDKDSLLNAMQVMMTMTVTFIHSHR